MVKCAGGELDAGEVQGVPPLKEGFEKMFFDHDLPRLCRVCGWDLAGGRRPRPPPYGTRVPFPPRLYWGWGWVKYISPTTTMA